MIPSVTTSTPPTPTIHTFYPSSPSSTLLVTFGQSRLGHPADTRAAEIGLFRLHASQTAQLLVALFLPLGDQRGVCVVVLQQPLVEGFGDGGFLVVEVVDVAGPWVLMLACGVMHTKVRKVAVSGERQRCRLRSQRGWGLYIL
jgi:hypothetical protein